VETRQQPPSQLTAILAQLFRKPQFLLPLVVVAGMLGVAFGVQPGGKTTSAQGAEKSAVDLRPDQGSPVASVTPTAVWTRTATVLPSATAAASSATPAVSATGTATGEVAGVRATATASATPEEEPDYTRDTTECGALQETAVPLAVEQNLAQVSVRAQRAAVYPLDYFRCILLATGGREAVALAGSIGKAGASGATHAVLVDLWVTNGSRDFAQVNLKTSTLNAAGQTFSPIATLGGRAEVVVASGQGRNVTLVGVLTNKVGGTTGPMTVSIGAPLVGGKDAAGLYQLFLPTP